MADRQVTQSRKDGDGDILALCNTGQNWSPRQKRDAINDIENGIHSYYVYVSGTRRVDIRVIQGQSGKYLRAAPDQTSRNNLDDLPNC